MKAKSRFESLVSRCGKLATIARADKFQESGSDFETCGDFKVIKKIMDILREAKCYSTSYPSFCILLYRDEFCQKFG